MDSTGRQSDSVTSLDSSGRRGTRFVHYGSTVDGTSAPTTDQEGRPAAVLVCHGMGQQVRYETISSIAEALRTEAVACGGEVAEVQVHLSSENNDFLARAEINWTDAKQKAHSVHVYEAYWAPVTEGRVSYWDTVKFLFSAGGNGLRYSRLFRRGTFKRWMFDDKKTMQIGRLTFVGILAVLAFLIAQVAIIGYVTVELAQRYKAVVSQSLPTGSHHILHAWLDWLLPFFPGYQILAHSNGFGAAWWNAVGHILAWLFLIVEAFVVRYFMIEYVGDVAAYISPYKDSKSEEIRHKIQKIGLDTGKVIYGFGPPQPAIPQYDKVVIVGHSLGSVLAYDTLNALINQDNVSAAAEQRNVVQRTRALLTFGSPLDKTAFIFRMQPSNKHRWIRELLKAFSSRMLPSDNGGWIREQLVASVQPLIVSYPLYRPASFEWINIWSRMDIISGELNYYDDPALPANVSPCVQNMVDPKAQIPLYAHVQYWNNPLLRQQLYRLVS